jgi:ribosomal protein S18 acetylase RimI-like enzyme
VLVADLDGAPAGYVTWLRRAEQGKIGLVAVDDRAHGRSIGSALVGRAVLELSAEGAERIVVVTQGRNVAGLRLYGRCGFLVRELELWFHKWYVPGVGG